MAFFKPPPVPEAARPMVTYSRGGLAPAELLQGTPFEGAALVLRRDRFELRLGFPNLPGHQARRARHAPRTLGLACHGDALVLLLRIEGLGTFELVHNHRTAPPDTRGAPPRLPMAGHEAQLVVVDTRLRTIQAARPVRPSLAFSEALDRHLDRLDSRVTDPGWRFLHDLEALRARGPEPERLLAHAEIVEALDEPVIPSLRHWDSGRA